MFLKGGIMIPESPAILLGFINTKLRDQYKDLDHLCDDLECDRNEIISKLKSIDYRYNKEQNQFR